MRDRAIVLLDTCVWIDSYCSWHPKGENAKRIIAGAAAEKIDLVYAVSSIKDVQYVLAQEYKRAIRQERGELSEEAANAAQEAAWAAVNNMAEIATAVGSDQSDVWIARKFLKAHNDLEDNLVLAAALRAKARYLVTYDKALLEHAALAGVAAVTPEDLLGVLADE